MTIRRLFFDIETSPNIGFFWRPGYKLQIGHENIIKERGIICVGYKWEGDKKSSCITWGKRQDDSKVVKLIAELLTEADEVVSHNGDKFDIPWVRGRCLKHGHPLPPRLVSQDTCALAKRLFNLNANRLDYIAQYLGFGGKMATGGFGLWRSVVLDKDEAALAKMVAYCKRDVDLLEAVWNKMKPYVPSKSRLSDRVGSCPECGGHHLVLRGTRTTEAGSKFVRLRCGDCGKWTQVAHKKYLKWTS